MQLSVIIINYNTFQLTYDCIASIIQYTYGLDYEIILIDNASDEFPGSIFKAKFENVIMLSQKQNLGFAKGNNVGIEKAKGEIILLLNSDTLIQDNSLLTAYQRLILDQQIGVLSAQLLYPDGKVQSCAQRFPSITLEIIELFRLQKLLSHRQKSRLLLGSFFGHQTEMEVDWVWGTFFMFRREVLKKLPKNKLPDDFFMYGEDMQWCYEIKKTGYKILYFPAASVIHYLSVSTKKNKDLDKQKMMITHEYVFLKKYYGVFYAWFIFKIRALKYWTLSWTNKDFKSLVAMYAKMPDLS